LFRVRSCWVLERKCCTKIKNGLSERATSVPAIIYIYIYNLLLQVGLYPVAEVLQWHITQNNIHHKKQHTTLKTIHNTQT
jgi:hypothetical protein